jgi:hypothetical protein
MPRKKKNDITIGDVVILLNNLYKKAKSLEYVKKPMSWALYHTWQEIDKKERKRAEYVRDKQ